MIATLVDHAVSAIKSGRFEEGLDLCDRALRLEPKLEPALAWRAFALVELGRAAEGAAAARRCLQHFPANEIVLGIRRRFGANTAAHARTVRDWDVGSVIAGRWEVFGASGGNMGKVYFVRDREWGLMEMAIKSLDRNRDSENARKLFRRETRVWLDLGGHPNIVSGYYTLEFENQLRFFMEFVDGVALSDLVRRADVDLERRIDLAIQIAAGMAYVHSKGVVHRDLKPDNCMVSADEIVKITDFGLGRTLSQLDGPMASVHVTDMHLDHAVAGTPLYMAPEQWRTLADAEMPADVYAFGAMVYEMLAGEQPFLPTPDWMARFGAFQPADLRDELSVALAGRHCDPRMVMRDLHTAGVPVPLRARGIAVPGPVDTLLAKCLAKDPKYRPTFARIMRDLADIYELVAGRPYPREIGRAINATEAGENNRAVSYHVMGKTARANEILDAWLAAHPNALYPIVNRALMDLAERKVAPAEVAAKLAELQLVHPGAFEHDPIIVEAMRRLSPWLLRGGSPVSALAMRRDGARVAVGHVDGTIALWDCDSGKRAMVLSGHEHRVSALAFDGDQVLVSASWDRTLRRWDLVRERHTVSSGSPEWLLGVAARGEFVVGAGGDGAIRVWDWSRGRLVHTVPAHRDAIDVMRWIGDVLATGARDGTVKLWRLDGRGAPNIVPMVPPASGAVSALAAIDGAIVIATHDNTLTARRGDGSVVWDVALPAPAIALDCETGDRALHAILQTGALVAIQTATGAITTLYDAAEPRVALVVPGARVAWLGRDDGAVWRLALDPVGDRPRLPFAIRRPRAAGEQAQLERTRERLVARVEAGDPSAHVALDGLRARTPELARARAIVTALHRSGARLGIRSGLRDVWSTWQLDCDSGITAIAIGCDAQSAWIGTREGILHLVDLESGRETVAWQLAGDSGKQLPLAHVVALVDGAIVAIADGTLVRVVAGETAPAWRVRAHGRAPAGVDLAGNHVVSVGDDELRAWDFATGTAAWQAKLERGSVGPVVAGDQIATASAAGIARWMRDGAPAGEAAIAIASPGVPGRALALVGVPAGFIVRTPATTCVVVSHAGHTIRTLAGATSGITAIAATPDGRLIGTPSRDYNDTRFYLWDARTAVARVLDHGSSVQQLAFAGGGMLLSGDDRGVVRAWMLDVEWCIDGELATHAELLADHATSALWPVAETNAAVAHCRSAAIGELRGVVARMPDGAARTRIEGALARLAERSGA